MAGNAKLATVAACAGDPARANMLSMLIDGRAFTAGELSSAAGVTPQTASGHLARMVDAGLLAVMQQGRHRYFRLASPLVAQMLEGMMVVAAVIPTRTPGPADARMRQARSCYDHIAGKLGVALADQLVDAGHLVLSEDGGVVTDSGRRFFARAGIDLSPPRPGKAFCRACLDWSERRYHLAGALGTRLMLSFIEQGWLRRSAGHRALDVTVLGRRKLHDLYGIKLDGK